MADILLVYPAPQEFKDCRFGFSLNLLYISSILKQAGHCIVDYIDYSIEPFDQERFQKSVEKANMVILEFDSFPLKRSINISHGEALAQNIKRDFGSKEKGDKKVIIFGNDLSIFPEKYPYSDYILTKEPEKNITAVIDSLVNEMPPPVLSPLACLDELPLPDRSLLSFYAQHGGTVDKEPDLEKSTLIRTSRGCMNKCVFCQRKAWFKRYQAHSIPYVLNEFSELKKNNYRNVWVADDNFTFDLKRAKSLLSKLLEGELTGSMKIALSSWPRIDEEFLSLARKANISIISFGVESANREILKFYKKAIDLTRFQEIIRYADSIGLYTVGNFIVGAPMETTETIDETFDYILDTPFDQVNVKILDYMAGSDLYKNLPAGMKNANRHVFACEENGLNDFPLAVLKMKINHFREKFRDRINERFKEKIKRIGPPYYTLRFKGTAKI